MIRQKHYLWEMNWKEAEEAFKKTTVAILPVGCLHAHGDAILGIDNASIEEIAKRLAGKTNAIICPTIPYGPTQALLDLPGTIHVDCEVLRAMLLDVCRGLNRWGISKIVFLNGHGGNDRTMLEVGYQVRRELGMVGVVVDWWNLIMELDPKYKEVSSIISEPAISVALGLLDPMKAKVRTEKVSFLGEKFSEEGKFGKVGRASLTVVGIMGSERYEPTEVGKILGSKASADLGREILDLVADYLVELIRELEKAKIPSFPS